MSFSRSSTDPGTNPRIELRKQALGSEVLCRSGSVKAIGFSLKRWSALARNLDDGHQPIANNPIENTIRPIEIGRNIWLVAGSEPDGSCVTRS